MPFTPSHAVVALPFIRTPLVPAAIAIGAMMPDLPLYFPVGVSYWTTHSWLGALLVDIPLSLGLLVLWLLVLRPAVPHLTPRWLRERWPSSWSDPTSTTWWRLWGGRGAGARTRLRAIALLGASFAIGIASHILWDDFTHANRWGSEVLPQLATVVGPFRIWAWAHYVCSVLGLVAIAVWGIRWLRRQEPQARTALVPRWFRTVSWLAFPACLLVAVVAVYVVGGAPDDSLGWRLLLEKAGKAGAAAILMIFAAVAVLIGLRAAVERSSSVRDTPGIR